MAAASVQDRIDVSDPSCPTQGGLDDLHLVRPGEQPGRPLKPVRKHAEVRFGRGHGYRWGFELAPDGPGATMECGLLGPGDARWASLERDVGNVRAGSSFDRESLATGCAGNGGSGLRLPVPALGA